MLQIGEKYRREKKKSIFICPDLCYQHGDDFFFSIKIQNNRKMPLRDKLIWERIGNFFQLWDHSILYCMYPFFCCLTGKEERWKDSEEAKTAEGREEVEGQQGMNKDDEGPGSGQSLSPGLVLWLCSSSLKAPLGG